MEEKEIKEQMGGKPEEIIPETPKDILIEILKTLKEGFKSLSEKIDTGFNSLSEKIDNGFNSLSKKIDEALYYQKDGQKIPYLKRIYEGLYYQEDGQEVPYLERVYNALYYQKDGQEKPYLGQLIDGIGKLRSEGNEWQLLKLYIEKKGIKNYKVIHIPESGADFIVELENPRNYYIIEVKSVLSENTIEEAIEQLIKRGKEVNCSVPKVGAILARFLTIKEEDLKKSVEEKTAFEIFKYIDIFTYNEIEKGMKIITFKKK